MGRRFSCALLCNTKYSMSIVAADKPSGARRLAACELRDEARKLRLRNYFRADDQPTTECQIVRLLCMLFALQFKMRAPINHAGDAYQPSRSSLKRYCPGGLYEMVRFCFS